MDNDIPDNDTKTPENVEEQAPIVVPDFFEKQKFMLSKLYESLYRYQEVWVLTEKGATPFIVDPENTDQHDSAPKDRPESLIRLFVEKSDCETYLTNVQQNGGFSPGWLVPKKFNMAELFDLLKEWRVLSKREHDALPRLDLHLLFPNDEMVVDVLWSKYVTKH